jgi:hypothetical protein
LLAFAAGVAGQVTMAQAQCPVPSNLPRLVINVQVPEPTITYHHDVDLFGLPKLEHHSERPPAGFVVLGLTKLSDHWSLAYQAAEVQLRDGRQCIWLTRIDALLGDPVMNVYVASEYAPDTCEYKVILNHENTHVRFNIETLHDWLPSVQAALTEAAKHKFPAIFAEPPSNEDVRHYLLDNMQAVFDLMSEDLAKRNATIDTLENYRRENAKCRNWSRHGFKLDH